MRGLHLTEREGRVPKDCRQGVVEIQGHRSSEVKSAIELLLMGQIVIGSGGLNGRCNRKAGGAVSNNLKNELLVGIILDPADENGHLDCAVQPRREVEISRSAGLRPK